MLRALFENLIPQESGWQRVNVGLTLCLLLLLIVLHFTTPASLNRSFRAWGRPFRALEAAILRRPFIGYALVFLLSLFLNLTLALIAGLPVPYAHDEFGYLLQADTFGNGRLTNPTHPHWPFFDTFHVLMQPSYMAKFPPGQGVILALGKAITGYAIAGVWLCHALACATIYGALRAVLPVRWALLGGLFVATNPQLLEWSQSYWGGILPMLGGGLVLGACLRLGKSREALPDPKQAILLGLGVVVLVNSRPYEGVIFSLLCLVAALAFRFRQRTLSFPLVLRAGLWSMVPIVPALCLMLLYNRAVTGSPTRMPYAEYQEQADPVPLFFGGKPRAVRTDLDPTIQKFYAANLKSYFSEPTRPADRLIRLSYRLGKFWQVLAYVPILLVGLLIACYVSLRRLWGMLFWGVAVLVLCFAASLWSFYTWSHYSAPYLSLYVLLPLVGLRWLSTRCRPGRARVFRLLPGVVIPLLLLFPCAAFSFAFCREDKKASACGWAYQRLEIQERLVKSGGKSLVFVQYGPDHTVHDEWVYNGSDIDGSPVVWARDKGDARNGALLAYYPDRTAYRIVVNDKSPVELVPYRSAAPQTSETNMGK